MTEYTCKDCVLHTHDNEPQECKEQEPDHKPCENFHPAEYIAAINYDTRT
jgi:hypothetical protein